MSRKPGDSDVFHAIADTTRRVMLDRLRVRALPVNEVAEGLDMSLPAVSQHLRILKAVGLVAEERQGRQRIYRLTPGPMKELVDWVSHYQQFWPARLKALGKHLERRNK